MDTITIQEAFENEKKHLILLSDKMKNETASYHYIIAFKYMNILNATYYMYVEGNFDKARNEFYRASIAEAVAYQKYKHDIFTAMNTILIPILSDSSTVKNLYAGFDRTEMRSGISFHLVKSIQAIWLERSDLLEEHIAGLKKWTKRGWEKNYIGIVPTLEGILFNDADTVHLGLNKVLFLHRKQEHLSIVGNYMNLEATALAKLAMQKGIKVEIDNALLPKALLITKELDNYEGYDFLTL
jgi:hypothetical protein